MKVKFSNFLREILMLHWGSRKNRLTVFGTFQVTKPEVGGVNNNVTAAVRWSMKLMFSFEK